MIGLVNSDQLLKAEKKASQFGHLHVRWRPVPRAVSVGPDTDLACNQRPPRSLTRGGLLFPKRQPVHRLLKMVGGVAGVDHGVLDVGVALRVRNFELLGSLTICGKYVY